MAGSEERDLDAEIELRVRRILSEIEAGREKAILESLQSQRDFLVGNTKWVVGGFFGLLIIFGALVTFIFGSQIDDRYFDALIGESISETIETKINTSIDASLSTSLDTVRQQIREEAQRQQSMAIEEVQNAVNNRINEILTNEVVDRINEVSASFARQSTQDILDGVFPSGAVIAFDRPDGCPRGWSPHTHSQGRFIIGVGSQEGLSARSFAETGGSETHTLVVAEMPSHSHFSELGTLQGQGAFGQGGNIPDAVYGTQRGPALLTRTSTEGGSRPHNNMPPFVALHFCVKDAG